MIKIMLCFTLEHCLENNGQDPKLKNTPSLDAREGVFLWVHLIMLDRR